MYITTDLKHSKEKSYFTILAILSVLAWLVFFPALMVGLVTGLAVMTLFFPVFLGLILFYFISAKILEANFLGESVKVTHNQYPEVHKIVEQQCAALGINNPQVFIRNSEGAVNAIATKILSKKYVILYSSIVDLLVQEKNYTQLGFIIGHELGHHAAGHLSRFKSIFLIPGKLIPFLGPAYSRACELTADRYGAYLIQDIHESKKSLGLIALGSKSLSNDLNVDVFAKQEHDINDIIGFLSKLWSTHPRLTIRVLALNSFNFPSNNQLAITSSSANTIPTFIPDKATMPSSILNNNLTCSNCSSSINSEDVFCGSCGKKLR